MRLGREPGKDLKTLGKGINLSYCTVMERANNVSALGIVIVSFIGFRNGGGLGPISGD